MKTQDAQLMQASGDTKALLMIGAELLPQPMAQVSKALGQTNHLGRACRSTRVEPFTPKAMCKATRTCMIGSSCIHVHQLISFVVNPLCAMCTK